MNKIKDIRIFRSKLPNDNGMPLPEGFANKHLFVIIRRIVLKLRENNFSLGEYDHFYLNFSTFVGEGEILPAPRSTGPAEAFFRFFDVGISKQKYPVIEDPGSESFVLEKLEEALIRYGCADEQAKAAVRESIRAAVGQGESMLMLYKTKTCGNCTAKLYLRFLDSVRYYPLLRVFRGEDLILEKNISPMYKLIALGEIRLTANRVSIYPRQNAGAAGLLPMHFDIPEETAALNNMVPDRQVPDR